jgi:cytochrome oxidase Cu insertion factor (SCO1/SenC/PrrC family)
MNHTASIFLVDSRGNLEDTLSSEEKDVSAVAKLKQLDKE